VSYEQIFCWLQLIRINNQKSQFARCLSNVDSCFPFFIKDKIYFLQKTRTIQNFDKINKEKKKYEYEYDIDKKKMI